MPASAPRKPWRLWLRQAAPWIMFPLLALALCEMAVRHGLDRPKWYEQARREVVAHHVDYLFIGSSRVAAAIDAPTFSAVMSKHLGRPVVTLNLGQGYSTWIEHALGLRWLYEIAPEHLQGSVVFAEAPGEVFTMGSWADRWYNPAQAQMILSVLRAKDLPALWHSGAGVGEKLYLTALYGGGRSMLVAKRAFIRQSIMEKGALIVKGLLQKTAAAWGFAPGAMPGALPAAAPDLTASGGIRADTEGIRQVRALALEAAAQTVKNQKVITDWSSPVYDDVRHLVEAQQGRIMLFAMPESCSATELYATAIGRQNRLSFERQFGSMHALMLRPAFAFTDEDFPDLWHLRKSRAPEFSAALAQAYIKATSHTLTRQ